MIPDKIIYTDGHDVVVTDSTLQVKNTSYKLEGITKHGLSVMRPERLPGIILFVTGIVLILVGLFEVIPYDLIEDVQFNDAYVSANVLAAWIGAGLAVIGIIVTFAVREKYAVRISTAEGDKDAVVSPKKEYIAQIVDALNKAFNRIQIHSSPYIAFKK